MTGDDLLGYDPSAHYDRVTEAWGMLLGEELHYGLFGQGNEPLALATAALTRRMCETADLGGRPLRLLDVGCGSGAPACTLATEYDVQVLGITTSPVGVEEATGRAASTGTTGVGFEVRDGTDNGLPDESFDRVWALESSHLMRDRAGFVAECARVLRPGGRFVMCDLIRRREIPFLEVRERRTDFATLRAAFGDAHMESLDFYARVAQEHGLVVDVSEDLTAVTLPTFDRWRDNAERHRDEVVSLLGARGHADFVRSCDILEAFWRDGTLGYGLLSATKQDDARDADPASNQPDPARSPSR